MSRAGFQLDARDRDAARTARRLRSAVAADLRERGHRPSDWKEYKSEPGKWTCFCRGCGAVIIAYDDVPLWRDQVVAPEGECLEKAP